ncbi:MAG: NTP transferase domain-containing protein [Planctomycetes bacterium]|nr:NTP transferase domain-containing protein [Planctomycetota bacterium]
MKDATLDKAVVMARGRGSRMQRPGTASGVHPQQAAVADSGLKAMIPIDRPFLDYVLSALADGGIHRVCLVIGPEQPTIREYYGGQVPLKRLSVEFAVQAVADGTAHAVAAAEAFAGRDDFLVLNADNYYPVQAIRSLVQGSGSAVALFERQALLDGSNIPAERIAQYAAARLDPAGNLAEIIEKPCPDTLARLPDPWLVSMNLWRFQPAIFRACRAIGPSPRDEFELVDAVRYAIQQLDVRFRAAIVRAPVLDLTCRDDIAPVTARLAGTEVWL